eukprot:CAMPEP_0119029884 /NCGR_PEP_ID=MMETSP1176-20130426/40748_1 /TAXON_ID=265551 /ORGANISM="Synedropsis recta cf, Strain CCMP1620" /LENGTH=293 /DNA_ID=CAMNT_0006986243 /DNA_START=912 /DNA_END=1790 /DNA_ORIENTATION=+
MGVQSQYRKKASCAIRNRSRHQLRANNTNTANIDLQGRCIQCLKLTQAKATGGPAPHRAHNKNCPNSRANRAQQGDTPTLPKGLTVTVMQRGPSEPRGRIIRNQEQINQFMAPRRRSSTGIAAPIISPPPSDTQYLPTSNPRNDGSPSPTGARAGTDPGSNIVAGPFGTNDQRNTSPTNLAGIIRRELDDRMLNSKPAAIIFNKAPNTIIETTSFILGQLLPSKFNKNSNIALDTERVQRSMKWYEDAFQGKAGFTFGAEARNVRPSPYYHSIVGSTVYFMRWELICPGIILH